MPAEPLLHSTSLNDMDIQLVFAMEGTESVPSPDLPSYMDAKLSSSVCPNTAVFLLSIH